MNYSTIGELAEHIRELKTMGVSITVFLGAGVSVSAGIPTAARIMDDIENRFPETVKNAVEKTYGEYMRCLKPGIRKEILKQYMINPQVNIAHLYLGSFVNKGFVDRILTTNFDPLAIKALGLNNIYPSIYDLAETRKFKTNEIMDPSIFYIHGRYNGYFVLNTDEELNIHRNAVRQLFEDTSKKRCWIVIGYSGENDPLFDQFSAIEDYTYGLFWVGRNPKGPKGRARDFLDSRADEVSYIGGYDADNFFIKLANALGVDAPELVSNPFQFLKNSLNLVSSVEKDEKLVNLTQTAIADIDNALVRSKKKGVSDIELLKRTREIWVFEQFVDIEEMMPEVLKTSNEEVKYNMLQAIINTIDNASIADTSVYEQYRDELLSQLKQDPSSVIEFPSKVKEYLSLQLMEKYHGDDKLTQLGFSEARKLFKTEKIHFSGKRLYGNDLVKPYIYRLYVSQSHFQLIEEKFKSNKKINVVHEIAKKLGVEIDYIKTHYTIPAIVGDDAELLHTDSDKAALIHLQITYGIKDGVRFPLELLVGKYLEPIGFDGFVTDQKPHTSFEYSKLVDNTLVGENKSSLLAQNAMYYYPFFSFVKEYEHLYSRMASPLLRVMLVTEEQCNYHCNFCCFLEDQCIQDSFYDDMNNIEIEQFQYLIECAVKAGFKRIMFTGGEPLLLSQEKLTAMVKVVASNDEIEDFWITTNASLLSKELLEQLRIAGLNKFVVSIPAETNEKYQKCNNQNAVALDDVFSNIKNAVDDGFTVRVDVPVNSEGIKNYSELMVLVTKIKELGVKELCYFELHKSSANGKKFSDLYVDVDSITQDLFYNTDWILQRDGNRANFIRDGFTIHLPGIPSGTSANCKKNKCGHFCQGNYASYLLRTKKGFIVRACHREFADGRNEFDIPYRQLSNEEYVTSSFSEGLKYAKNITV